MLMLVYTNEKKIRKIPNCEVMKALSFIFGSSFLYLCATGQFAGHEREVFPSIKANAPFVSVQSGELQVKRL